MSSVFLETIKALDGEIYHIEYHQQRYEEVLKKFDITQLEDLSTFLNPPKYGLYRCRLTYDLSVIPHSIDVEYFEYKKRDIKTIKLIFDNNINYSYKSTCRDEIDKLFDLKEEADEILIIKDLLVSDTSVANIAFYTDNGWITPRQPLLKGTTRARLIKDSKLSEADIKVQDLRSFSKVALLNAMIDFDVLEEYEFLI